MCTVDNLERDTGMGGKHWEAQGLKQSYSFWEIVEKSLRDVGCPHYPKCWTWLHLLIRDENLIPSADLASNTCDFRPYACTHSIEILFKIFVENILQRKYLKWCSCSKQGERLWNIYTRDYIWKHITETSYHGVKGKYCSHIRKQKSHAGTMAPGNFQNLGLLLS